jgi:hypothetical protein
MNVYAETKKTNLFRQSRAQFEHFAGINILNRSTAVEAPTVFFFFCVCKKKTGEKIKLN